MPSSYEPQTLKEAEGVGGTKAVAKSSWLPLHIKFTRTAISHYRDGEISAPERAAPQASAEGMSYDLAKELKEAGFPQKEDDDQELMDGITIEVLGESVYAPTLSELIDACGERFHSLSYHRKTKKWIAASQTAATFQREATENTPEEAVARLWLELNRKI